ncbi:MAG: T9SS type A sorting domain-containing protein [Bacteroidota bacterium]
MKIRLLLTFSFFSTLIYAQLQNNTWYFSPTNKGIQFNPITNIPSVISGHASLTSLHGCGIASNPVTGNVMFYTDAVNVYDNGNVQMPNGTGLSGGVSCASKGDIVQVPGYCNRYYVFSNDADSPYSGSIRYSIVNMNLSGNGTVSSPKGDVESISKNTLVTTNSTEAYTIVRKPSGNSYWLIVPMNNSDSIKIFSITSGGINYSNTFHTGTVFNSSFSIKYSENAGKVAYISVVENDPALLINFNSNSGTFSTVSTVTGTPVGTCTNIYNGWHDLEFSPDGSKLYLSKYRMYTPVSAGRIYQYNLNTPSIPLSVVFNNPSTDNQKVITGMQRGPDGKIYFLYFNTNTNDDRIIGAINKPDSVGIACSVNPLALNLTTGQSFNSRFSKCALFNNEPSHPIVINDNASATLLCKDSVVTINIDILNNDSNSNPLMTNYVSILTFASNGTTQLQPNNTIQYTSNVNFIGKDTISYVLCDNNCFSSCDTGFVFIQVNRCIHEGVDEVSIDHNFEYYPNPANDELNLNFSASVGTVKFEIIDILGKQVFVKELYMLNNKIDLTSLSNGVYTIRCSYFSSTQCKKLVIEK